MEGELKAVNSAAIAPLSRVQDEAFQQAYGRYISKGESRLNIGCALNHEPGWVNLDMDSRVHPDVLFDVENVPLPFEDNTFDCILGSHVFEHVVNLVPLMHDLYRILKPGGFLLAITPYGSSDDAWDCPHHVRSFTENTWAYFSKRLYAYAAPNAGHGAWQGGDYQDWTIAERWLVPYPEFANDPEIEFKKRHWRNVISELHVVLQKQEG